MLHFIRFLATIVIIISSLSFHVIIIIIKTCYHHHHYLSHPLFTLDIFLTAGILLLVSPLRLSLHCGTCCCVIIVTLLLLHPCLIAGAYSPSFSQALTAALHVAVVIWVIETHHLSPKH